MLCCRVQNGSQLCSAQCLGCISPYLAFSILQLTCKMLGQTVKEDEGRLCTLPGGFGAWCAGNDTEASRRESDMQGGCISRVRDAGRGMRCHGKGIACMGDMLQDFSPS